MSEKLNYRVSGQTLLIQLENDCTVRSLLDVLSRALNDPAAMFPSRLLIDARESRASHTPAEVRLIVDELTPWAPRIDRLAVVANSDLHYGLARMGSTLCEGSGIESAVFRQYSDALRYLGISDDFGSA